VGVSACYVEGRLGSYVSNPPNVYNFNGGSKCGSGWNFFVLTRDGVSGVASGFVNGVLVNTVSAYVGQLTSGSGLSVIGGGDEWGSYLTGSLDDLRVYNRILSPAEVMALYNAQK
jgi:hypothetical protein